MIGVSIFQCVNSFDEPQKGLLIKESWHKLNQVLLDNNTDICYSYYDSYIINYWDYDNSVIIIEGCIFNKSDEEIRETLNTISKLESNSEIKKRIATFINDADGDYLVVVYNKTTKRFVIFNDLIGGLSVNYLITPTNMILSRSLAYVAVNCNEAVLSKENLAEFSMFGFNLGNHTIYKNIYKLTPGTCIISEVGDNGIFADISYVIEPSFVLKEKYHNKKEAIKDLSKIFLESCKSRVEYAKRNKFEIVNTMSGGFDSRTILGGIEKYIQSYTNLTYEYKMDESVIAREVLKHIDSKSEYIKLCFKNIPHVEDTKLAFETDGKVEAYTNAVCYNDIKYAKENVFKGKKLLYFGGFGGEFLRHPMKPLIQPTKEWGMSFGPSAKFASKIFGCKMADLCDSINKTLYPHSEQGKEAVTKYHYNEYYQNYVRCSGEERTRLFFFTVQPMMSNLFIRTIRNRVPLRWAGFRFYRDFLKEIDKRLVEVDLYGNAVNIKSTFSLVKRDFKQNFTVFQYVRYLQRKFTRYEYKERPGSIDIKTIEDLYRGLPDKNSIDIEFVRRNYKSFGGLLQVRILSLLGFLYECEEYKKQHISL